MGPAGIKTVIQQILVRGQGRLGHRPAPRRPQETDQERDHVDATATSCSPRRPLILLIAGLGYEIVATQPVRERPSRLLRPGRDRQPRRPSRGGTPGAWPGRSARRATCRAARSARPRGGDRRPAPHHRQELPGLARGAERLDLPDQTHQHAPPGVSVRPRGRGLAVRRTGRHPPPLGRGRPDHRDPGPRVALTRRLASVLSYQFIDN